MTTFPRHTHPDDTSELLSGYLDGALDVVERRRTDQLLADCAGCAAELADLRTLRTLLRELPAPLPRRSFTLDPNMVRPRPRLFPIFRIATFAAALLLVVVLGVDTLVPTTGTSPTQSVALKARGDTGAGASSYTSEAAATAAQAEIARSALTQVTAAAAPPPQGTLPIPAAAPMPQPTAAAGAAAVPAATAAAESAAAAGAAGAEGATEVAAADAAVLATDVPPNADALETMEQTGPAPTPGSLEDSSSSLTGSAEQPAAGGGTGGGSTTGGITASGPLANSEPAGVDTTALNSESAPSQPAGVVRPLRLFAYLLGALTLALGGATWWTARRRI